MGKQNIFRFQIAMNDLVMVQQDETLKKLFSESPNELQRETSEVVCLDEFVQVHAEKVSGYAKVAAEVEALVKVNNAVFLVGVLPSR